MNMARTVSTSLVLFHIVASTFSALQLAELGAPGRGFVPFNSLYIAGPQQLATLAWRQHRQNSRPTILFLILKYRYPPLSSALPPGCWVMSS